MTVEDVLARLSEVTPAGEKKWQACCPAHDDTSPSLSITEAEDGNILFYCHAGCSQEEVRTAVGVEWNDLFSDQRGGSGKGDPEKIYPYTDKSGQLLYEVCRFPGKKFSQRRPDGNGGYLYNLNGTPRVLYRLPALLAAVQAGKPVFVTEGEKDADRLREMGLCATTSPGGANKWRGEYAPYFSGASSVIILPDNDAPGRQHAETVAQSLHGTVPSVKVVRLPGLPDKGDVSDWLDAGGDTAKLLTIVNETPDWAPSPVQRRLPPPVSVSGLRQLVATAPPEEWLVRGVIPTDANILLVAYPKSGKTLLVEDLVISLASGTPFLGRFPVAGQRRVGLVLMEDGRRQTLARLERMCLGKGLSLDALEGWLHLWFRPPLTLVDEAAVQELGDYVTELELDFLAIDNFQNVNVGNENQTADVQPQLMKLSALKERRPGLTVQLTHHARKEGKGQAPSAQRVTDLIRGTGSFGGWFDVGIVLSRRDERAPVTVRLEARDGPAPAPFAVLIEDECEADPNSGQHRPSGWLRLQVSEDTVAQTEQYVETERLIPSILAVLRQHPTISSKNALREQVSGSPSPNAVKAALDLLQRRGVVKMEPGGKRGAISITLVRDPEGAEIP